MAKDKSTINISKNIKGIASISGGTINQIFHLKPRIPSQLTTKLSINTNFIGKEYELKEIEQRLNQFDSLLIKGMGGIGKSAIASYYLSLHKEHFHYYGFFEGLDNFSVELKASLNLQSQKEDELFLEALSKLIMLEGKKLFVIDNVKDIEENQEKIEKILALTNNNFQILFTSREEIENITIYELNLMSVEDAKKLFNSIYKVDNEKLLKEILAYLDYHPLFIEITAKTLKNKKTLTPKKLKDMFESGRFAKIKVKRKQNFNDYVTKIFTFDKLDKKEILILKQFSILPSIEIEFTFLQKIFQSDNNEEFEEFEEILSYLSEKGWLTKTENSYKLHQIIKEYILENHQTKFDEIKGIIEFFSGLMANSNDPQIAIDNRPYLIFFNTILQVINYENETIAFFLNRLGNIYFFLKDYQKSLSLHQEDLRIRKKIFGEYHLSTAKSYSDLAGVYELLGDYNKALPLYKKDLAISKKFFKEFHPNIAISYNNLGGLSYLMGDYDNALFYTKKSLEINKSILGESHPNTASNYNTLATIYYSTQEYEKALPLFKKTLEINKEILGEKHPHTATTYNNLAELYQSIKQYKEALLFCEKALNIRVKVFGEAHIDTIDSYNNLAILYYILKEYNKAEVLFEKVLKAREILLGEQHSLTISAYNNLAILYFSIGDLNKERYYKEKIENLQKIKSKKEAELQPIDSTYLEAIKIKNYFSIKDMEIEDLKGKKEIYFVGENGDGKTVLLQAIALALKGDDYDKSAHDYIKKHKNTSENMSFETIDEKFPKEYKSYKNINNLFAYGINRNKVSIKDSDESGYSGLFDTPRIKYTTELRDTEVFLKRDEPIIDDFVQAIQKLMDDKFVIHRDGNTIKFGDVDDFDMLSEGYKTTLIWLSDLVSRLMENSPSIEKLENYQAIVLIDEVDLYLHPKWKYDFMNKLRKIFPNIQFIMTTHSLVTILGASEDAVFYKVYKEGGETKITGQIDDISYYTSNILLTSPIFSLDSMKARGFKKDERLSSDDYIYREIHTAIREHMKKNPSAMDDELKQKVKAELKERLAKLRKK